MPPMEGLPLGIDSWDNVSLHASHILLASSHKLAGPLEEWLEQQTMHNSNIEAPYSSPPPFCNISDLFTGWVHSSGAKFGIPIVVFHTSGETLRWWWEL